MMSHGVWANATVRLCPVGAEEVQQLRESPSLDFSKDHSDPYWTGQTFKMQATRSLRGGKKERAVLEYLGFSFSFQREIIIVDLNPPHFLICL